MSVVIKNNRAHLEGICTLEEVEPLLNWLSEHPGGEVELGNCKNLHAAVLQTLLAGKAECKSWPTDPTICLWVKAALL